MKNNKGFTLVELIATIVILGVVLSITGFAITTVIKKARTKNYELLITDIKSAAELYYQECTYMSSTALPNSMCENGQVKTITLGDLVDYGYLTSNDTSEAGAAKVIHPNTEANISSCKITVTFSSDQIKVTAVSPTGSCPTGY